MSVDSRHGSFQSIPQMPEHMGISFGTAKMVSDACDAWLKKRGLKKSMREIRDDDFFRRAEREAAAR